MHCRVGLPSWSRCQLRHFGANDAKSDGA